MLSTVSLLSCCDSEPQTTPVFHKVTIINLAVDNLNVEIMFVKKVFPRPGLLTKKIFQCSHRRQDPIPESPGGWHPQWGQSTGGSQNEESLEWDFPRTGVYIKYCRFSCMYIHIYILWHTLHIYIACMIPIPIQHVCICVGVEGMTIRLYDTRWIKNGTCDCLCLFLPKMAEWYTSQAPPAACIWSTKVGFRP